MSNIYTGSPFISKRRETIKIEKGFFGNSISNFHFGSTNLYIKGSKFTKFLSSVVINSRLYTHNTGIVSNDPHTSVYNSIFQDITEEKLSGAAINTFGSLELVNCLFDNIKANEAPAYKSFGNFTVVRCSFSNLKANTDNGIFSSKSKDDFDSCFNYSNSRNTAARYQGLFRYESQSKLTMFYVNMTRGISNDCVGGFDVRGAVFYVKFGCFNEISAEVHHGLGILRNVGDILISSSLFIKCSHKSHLSNSAACLLIEGSSLAIDFSDCYILGNVMASGKVMYFEPNINPLFSSCYFSCKEDDIYSSGKPVFYDCQFDVQQTETNKISYIGFNVDFHYKDKHDRLIQSPEFYNYLGQSLAVSFVFSLIAACVHYLLSLKKYRVKTPKSLE